MKLMFKIKNKLILINYKLKEYFDCIQLNI